MNVKFIETSLLEKENFYSQRNVEEITNTDCTLVKKNCKDFEIKLLGEYHDLYVQRWLMNLRTFEICLLI